MKFTLKRLLAAIGIWLVVAIAVWVVAQVFLAIGYKFTNRIGAFLDTVDIAVGFLAGLWYFLRPHITW